MYTKLMNLKDGLELITDNDIIRIWMKSMAVIGSILAGREIAKKSSLVTGIMAAACMTKVGVDFVEAVIDKIDDVALGIECMDDDEFDDWYAYDDEIPDPPEEKTEPASGPSVTDITEEPMSQPQYSAKHITADSKDEGTEVADAHG